MTFIQEFGKITHDAAVSKCFLWMWNKLPQTRYTCFHPANETKKEYSESPQQFAQRLARRKAYGVVPGVLDLIWLWQPIIVFDIKLENDTLSPDQRKFITAVESKGGKGFEIRSLQSFQEIVLRHI